MFELPTNKQETETRDQKNRNGTKPNCRSLLENWISFSPASVSKANRRIQFASSVAHLNAESVPDSEQ